MLRLVMTTMGQLAGWKKRQGFVPAQDRHRPEAANFPWLAELYGFEVIERRASAF